MNLFRVLWFSLLVIFGILSAVAGEDGRPEITGEEIALCKEGRIDVLLDYLGETNSVVMICTYHKKLEMMPSRYRWVNAKLTSYSTVVQSTDKNFPVGRKLKEENTIESVDKLAPQRLDLLLKVDGRLWYLINPRFCEEPEGDQKAVVSYQYGFPIDAESRYKSIISICEVPPRKAKALP